MKRVYIEHWYTGFNNGRIPCEVHNVQEYKYERVPVNSPWLFSLKELRNIDE